MSQRIDVRPMGAAVQSAGLVAHGSLFFVGTATVILRYGGFTILTDPNFLHQGDRDIPDLVEQFGQADGFEPVQVGRQKHARAVFKHNARRHDVAPPSATAALARLSLPWHLIRLSWYLERRQEETASWRRRDPLDPDGRGCTAR